MEPTTPSFESNASPEAVESLEMAAAECLDMLEGEREISMDLIEDSERLITVVIRALDGGPVEAAGPVLAQHKERLRCHLTALRAFLGGGFCLNTKES
jgi:hypothetical protein